MRVVGGAARGRRLVGSHDSGITRPLSDRAKEALFNILQARVPGAHFLDLYAGTGAVGIEALSRGAASATFVEQDRGALRVLRDNLASTQLHGNARVVGGDVFAFIEQARTTYDLIFAGPPQWKQLYPKTVLALDHTGPPLAGDGILILQCDPKESVPLELVQLDEYARRDYGKVRLTFLRRTTSEETPP